jgi:addiction module HigA family antidote
MGIELHWSIAIHPGDWLKTEIVEPHGLSVTEAAGLLHVSRQALSALLNGRADLSPEMAIRFEKVFGIDAGTTLRMQARWDIKQARERQGEIIVERSLVTA